MLLLFFFLFLLVRRHDRTLVLPTIGFILKLAQTTTRPRPTQPLGSPVLAKICILLAKQNMICCSKEKLEQKLELELTLEQKLELTLELELKIYFLYDLRYLIFDT